jgi:hypothetical protein
MTLQITTNDLEITKLAYEKINDQYSKAKYLSIECIMDMKTGYINATKFCSTFGNGKTLNKYLVTDRCKNIVTYLEEPDRYQSGSISVLNKDNTSINELRGTYVHSNLLLDLSSWISPAAYFKASQIVKNVLVREKEDEIRSLTGDKSRLEKMFEEEKIERREAEKINKQLLLDMKLQNEKTHIKLDNTTKTLEKAEIDNDKIKTTLARVETRIDLIVDEIVPPARQVSLHEEFGVMKLNDITNARHYKVYCSQKRGVTKAKNSILKAYPNAVMFKEVTPNANAKNFLHILKEKYGSTNSKIQVSYNFIKLKSGVLEEELNTMINDVVDSAKNYGK